MSNIINNILKSQETIFICSMTRTHIYEVFQDQIDKKKNMIWFFEGNRLTSEKRIFHEFYLKLSFPDSYKKNWDIFFECIQDDYHYSGNKSCNHFFIFDHAISLNNIPEKDLSCFISMLASIESTWRDFQKKNQFCKIIFCCQHHQVHILMDMLSAIKISYAIIDCGLLENESSM